MCVCVCVCACVRFHSEIRYLDAELVVTLKQYI